LAFKASGNGEGLGSWVEGGDPCVQWTGVTCGGGGTAVTALNLTHTAVSGDVGRLAAMTQLTTLQLAGTAVTGCPLRLANGNTCNCDGSSNCQQ
jgi:hypothetical protein